MQMFFSAKDAKAFLKVNGFSKLAGDSYIGKDGTLAVIVNKGAQGTFVTFA